MGCEAESAIALVCQPHMSIYDIEKVPLRMDLNECVCACVVFVDKRRAEMMDEINVMSCDDGMSNGIGDGGCCGLSG